MATIEEEAAELEAALTNGTATISTPSVTSSQAQQPVGATSASTSTLSMDDMVKMLEDNIPQATVDSSITTIPEATDEAVTEEDSQDTLAYLYKDKYADLFDDNGKLVNVARAKELGIVRNAYLPNRLQVPTGADYDVLSVATSDLDLAFVAPEIAVEEEKNVLRRQMDRVERVAFDRADFLATLEDSAAAKDIDVDTLIRDDIIPSMDGDESPYLKALFENTGTWGFKSLQAIATGINYAGAGFQDGVEVVATQLQDSAPDVYDQVVKSVTGAKRSPKQFANSAGKEAFNFLTYLDTLPAMGVIALPMASATSAQKKSIQAANDFTNAINKHIAAKNVGPDALAKAGKVVEQARLKLNSAVTKEIADTDVRAAKEADKARKIMDKVDKRAMSITRARAATLEERLAKQAKASEVAANNTDVSNDLIRAFEEATGKTISIEGPDGVLRLDPDAARKAGIEKTEEVVSRVDELSVKQLATGVSDKDVNVSDLADLATGQDSLIVGMVKPEKFDGIVAAAVDLKAKFPDAFADKTWKTGPRKGKKYTVIDHLFELTVNKDLTAGKDILGGEELIDMLNKYDISFEDYVLTIVGSGSEAGKILQKLSQIKRSRPLGEMAEIAAKAARDSQDVIRKNFMRIEGIRRGGLVSQLATAARNLQSVGIRAPLDGIANVFDTALYNLSNKGVVSGGVTLLNPAEWGRSFRHMKYIFGPEYGRATKEYVDFLGEQPELAKQFDMLLNNINEIQKSSGRVDAPILDYGTKLQPKYLLENVTSVDGLKSAAKNLKDVNKLDAVLSMGEDVVEVLNGPNRMQEYLVRRGYYFAELERLIKREWGVDFIDVLNDGKIRDVLNDASTVKPEGARSFIDIAGDATMKALDATYAKQPDIKLFADISNLLVRNGLTTVVEFPRFMFNSMELMGQYAGGASLPLTRQFSRALTLGKVGGGKVTAHERKLISRNIAGAVGIAPVAPALIGAALEDEDKPEDTVTNKASKVLLDYASFGAMYMIRTMPGASGDYKMIRSQETDAQLDTTPLFPLRQGLYLAEATRQIQNGTFDDKFDYKDFTETFFGTTARTGTSNAIAEEVINLFEGTDLTSDEKAAKAAGRILGNYLRTWAVPYAQIIEAERALGTRGLTYKDAAKDPTLDASTTFMQELSRPFAQSGMTTTPKEETALPDRPFLFQGTKSRKFPILRVVGGLNITTADSEEGDYLNKLGYTDFEIGSRSRVPSIRNFENKVLSKALPQIIAAIRPDEEVQRNKYRYASADTKRTYTEEEYVLVKIRPLVKASLQKVKNTITTKNGESIHADAPRYVSAMMNFRRVPKEIRARAMLRFREEEQRSPDGASVNDLEKLYIIGQEIKKVMDQISK